MVNNNGCRCENCGRTNNSVQINPVTVDHHTAYLCLACEHVLHLPENKNRFFSLVRSKNRKQANPEMQGAHRILSAFIAVGVLFFVAIAALGVAQSTDIVTLPQFEAESILINEQLTFLQLRAFN
ncbi:DNA polymerase III subunit delta [Solibacillus sp. FSL R5-0691]|uniref:DNA polymerase III subunit delta n=1 Tax=unclassified Solibacillus TaxID=2637870 RepID=UPI0030D2C5F7